MSEDLRGQWSIVFFYPADFTFVYPTELGDLADHYEAFQKLGVEVYSVSTDTHFVHKAWPIGARSSGSTAALSAFDHLIRTSAPVEEKAGAVA